MRRISKSTKIFLRTIYMYRTVMYCESTNALCWHYSSGVDRQDTVERQRGRTGGSRYQHNMQCIRHSVAGNHLVQTRRSTEGHRQGAVPTGDTKYVLNAAVTTMGFGVKSDQAIKLFQAPRKTSFK